MVPDVQHRFTWPLLASVFCAVLGSLQAGFHMGNMNSLQSIIENFFFEAHWWRYHEAISPNKTQFLWRTTVIILYLGAGLSAGFSISIARVCGRRTSILFCNVISLAAVTLMAGCRWMQSYEALIVGRFFMGVFCGFTMVLIPLYIQEISPINLRATLTAMNYFSLACGIITGQVLSLEYIMGSDSWWTWMMTISVAPAVLQLVTFPWCPESPRHLFIIERREREAVNALLKLRGTSDVWMEVDDLNSEAVEMKEKVTFCQLLSNYRKQFFIVFIVNVTTTLSGFSGTVGFSTETLQKAGFLQAHEIVIGLSLMSITSIALCALLVEKVGRKKLLLIGHVSLAICNGLMAASEANLTTYHWMKYCLAAMIYIFVFTYQIGPGPISQFIAADLFPPAARPVAKGITESCSFIMACLVAMGYQLLRISIGPYRYLIFAGVQVAAAVYTHFCFPG